MNPQHIPELQDLQDLQAVSKLEEEQQVEQALAKELGEELVGGLLKHLQNRR